MKKDKIKELLLYSLIIIVLVVVDQMTKTYAIMNLKEKPPLIIIDGFLELNYLENRGAAFGMLQNQKVFFLFVASIILFVLAWIIYKLPVKKKFRPVGISLSLVAGGAIGNMVDRIRFEYVIDFIYLKNINFPIFNTADIYVSIATIVLLFYVIFILREDDLNFLSFKEKRYRDIK